MLNQENLENKRKKITIALFRCYKILVYVLVIGFLYLYTSFPQNDIMLLSSPNDISYFCFHVNNVLLMWFLMVA